MRVVVIVTVVVVITAVVFVVVVVVVVNIVAVVAIIFFGTIEIENEWKYQWKGDMFFSHGSDHSKGVLMLANKNDLDFRGKKVTADKYGRFIIMNAEIQDSQFFGLVNLYAPNTVKEQLEYLVH